MKNRKTKKPKKANKKIVWKPILISSILDLIVGIILIILDRLFK